MQDGKLIGGDTIGGILITALNGFGLDLLDPPALEAQLELMPEELVVTARNAGRGTESFFVERLDVSINAAEPGAADDFFHSGLQPFGSAALRGRTASGHQLPVPLVEYMFRRVAIALLALFAASFSSSTMEEDAMRPL